VTVVDLEVSRRAAVASANPSRWVEVEGEVLFDTAPASDWTAAVAGYKLHGAVSADGDTVEFQDVDADGVAAYIAALFLRPVAATDSAVGRLRMLEDLAGTLVKRLARSANVAHGVVAPGLAAAVSPMEAKGQ
jgi:hypothetical protein